MVTIRDIAKLANVSATTVSRVINNKTEGVSEETRQRVLQIIKELNYQPNSIARSMVTKRTYTLALVIPDICNPFFPELARGVEDTANKFGYHLILCNTDGDLKKEENYIRFLRGKFVDGIIFTTQNNVEYNPIFFQLKKEKYPYAFIERYVEGLEDIPSIYFSNFKGAYMATKYLFKNGHEQIAFISGPQKTTNARQRLQGFIKAYEEIGKIPNYNLIKEGDYKEEGGYKAAKELLEKYKGEFSAIFAANDLMAIGAAEALKEYKLKIPHDISLIGFDSISLTKIMDPPLTTIEIPAYQMGVKAAEMVIQMIEGKEIKERKVIFEPKLLIRESITSLNSD